MPYLDPQSVFDRQVDRLDEAYERGELTSEEYREEMRLLQAEYRDMAAEAAREEYDSWFR